MKKLSITIKPSVLLPTSEMKLFKGEIKYLAAGNQIFEISDQVKESLANRKEPYQIFPNYI